MPYTVSLLSLALNGRFTEKSLQQFIGFEGNHGEVKKNSVLLALEKSRRCSANSIACYKSADSVKSSRLRNIGL